MVVMPKTRDMTAINPMPYLLAAKQAGIPSTMGDGPRIRSSAVRFGSGWRCLARDRPGTHLLHGGSFIRPYGLLSDGGNCYALEAGAYACVGSKALFGKSR